MGRMEIMGRTLPDRRRAVADRRRSVSSVSPDRAIALLAAIEGLRQIPELEAIVRRTLMHDARRLRDDLLATGAGATMPHQVLAWPVAEQHR